MAQYLVNEIMPNIDHEDPLNCLLSSLTLVYIRIKSLNQAKQLQKIFKKDPMID